MAREKGKRWKVDEPIYDATALAEISNVAVNEYRKITFDKNNAEMANKQKFPKYSKGYEKQKQSGKIASKKTGFTSVAGGYENSTAPFVRGDLHNDTQPAFSERKQEIYIGWSSHAKKIEWLRKSGRILASKSHPVHPKVIKALSPFFKKNAARKFPKGKHTITIGKKK